MSIRAYRRRAQLDELAARGLDLARELGRRVGEARSVKEVADLANQFADVSREVQRAILLADRLERRGGEDVPSRVRRAQRRTETESEQPATEAPAKIVKH